MKTNFRPKKKEETKISTTNKINQEQKEANFEILLLFFYKFPPQEAREKGERKRTRERVESKKDLKITSI